MRELSPTEAKRLHRDWRRRTSGRLAVILDGVQGPFNVGAIVRTAAAYRLETLWVSANATGPDHPKVGKTALGTERFRATVDVETAAEAVVDARAAGYRVIGLELADGAAPLHETDLRGDICLVVGNEDHGISKAALAACDAAAYLPQLGKVGSLNVATAASIAIYEWARQHWDGRVPLDDTPEPA
jgi:tRNA (guanosine-2'-O-)-methyltransferase